MDEYVISKLEKIVGKYDIATNIYERMLYSHDSAPIPQLISSLFQTIPDAVVRPESAEEIAQILRLASDYGTPVIPRGAASFALGGVIPVKGGIILDLVKLNKIGELSTDGSWIQAEAGVIYKDLMDYLSARGLAVYSYPTSAPSSTVGGWISTGGHGIGSLKYGPIWEQVIEMDIVTPAGEIRVVSKDSTDLKVKWFFGTEGQLGIITRVKLGIRHKPEKISARAVYVTEYKRLAELAAELTYLEEPPYFVTIMDSDLVNLKNSLSKREPEDKNLILTAFEGSAQDIDSAAGFFTGIIKKRNLIEIEQDIARDEMEELFFPMRIGRLGPTLLAGEVIIPKDQLNPVLNEINSLYKKSKLRMGIEIQAISRDSLLLLVMYLSRREKLPKIYNPSIS